MKQTSGRTWNETGLRCGRSPRQGLTLRAFTLVEILIVVVILGILAVLVIAPMISTQEESTQSAFTSNLKTFAQAAILYQAKTGDYLEGAASGVLPSGFENYVSERSWTQQTPIGGVWDTELNSYGITSALGVHFNGTGITHDDAFMTEIDDHVDDGDLATGAFRKLDAGRYYWILAD